MIATLLRLARRRPKADVNDRFILTSDTEKTLGKPFDALIRLPNAARRDLPTAMALELVQIVIDSSGGTTNTSVGKRATFIATLSADLAESAYEAVLVTPSGGHASVAVNGGVSYEWRLCTSRSGPVRGNYWDLAIERPCDELCEPLPLHAEQTAQAVPPDFEATYRALRARDTGMAAALIAPRDCAITHVARQWIGRFPASGWHEGPSTLAILAAGALVWAFYPLLYSAEVDAYVLTVALARNVVVVVLSSMAFHFAARQFCVTISPEGLMMTRASPLRHRWVIVPLAKLARFEHRITSTTGTSSSATDHQNIFAVEHGTGTRHAISPTLSAPGVIEALTIEMNDALDDVRHYGVTPAPEVAGYVFSDRARTLTKLAVGGGLALLWAVAVIVFNHVAALE
jgi:hypothetical protein